MASDLGFFQSSVHLPQLTLGPASKAELHAKGFADRAEHRAPLSRKTPADVFRTVRRAMFANMAVRGATKAENELLKRDENVTVNHTRPLHEARHFD